MFVAASPTLTDRWNKLCAALDAAAVPHTGKQTLPLSPVYLMELPGASQELETAKLSAPSGREARGMPARRNDGVVGFEIIW